MGKTAFLFPGQGSQKVGMGRALCEAFPAAQAVFEQADALPGRSLSRLCFEGPEEELKATENAQPALYTTSVAALRALQSVCSVPPDAVAGHSVGEYAALTAAGVLDFEEGLKLVRRRGELMRDAAAARPGAMIALLGADREMAEEACRRAAHTGIVSVANVNGGGQIVLSGEKEAVQHAAEAAKALGAKKAIPLAVSGGFHSPLMASAGDALYADLSRTPFRKPQIPIVANVTAKYVESPGELVFALTLQVSGSVLWEPSMQLLLEQGFDTFIELGSGEVLCGLLKRIAGTAEITALSVQSPEGVESARLLLEKRSCD